MKAKEKAKELFRKIKYSITTLKTNAEVKQCALICVEEIINEHKLSIIGSENEDYEIERIEYWKEVKTEIEKL